MPDDKGRPIFKVTPPPRPGALDDCLDAIYEVLVAHGYALTMGTYHGQSMIVLSAQPDGPGTNRLEPAAQIASMMPGPKTDPRFGIIMRRVGGVKYIEVVQ